MCELSESYELWVKVMQDAGLSYGPADTLIAHLEAGNERLRELLKKQTLWSDEAINSLLRKETPCP